MGLNTRILLHKVEPPLQPLARFEWTGVGGIEPPPQPSKPTILVNIKIQLIKNLCSPLAHRLTIRALSPAGYYHPCSGERRYIHLRDLPKSQTTDTDKNMVTDTDRDTDTANAKNTATNTGMVTNTKDLSVHGHGYLHVCTQSRTRPVLFSFKKSFLF